MTAFDWQRLWWGTEPWAFYGEIVLRALVMYLVLLLLLRFLSKRALTQLSILEFGIVIILGSAAGDPTFYKDVPLFHGIVVLVVIVLVQRVYTYFLRNNETIETAMEGTPIQMILQGVIQPGALLEARLAQEELFQLLRCNGVTQLGEVEVAYMEQNGQLSVFKCEKPFQGLAIVPPWDLSPPQVLNEQTDKIKACLQCGKVHTANTRCCTACGHDKLTDAVFRGDPLH